MRIVQTFILKLLGLLALVSGGALVAMWLRESLYVLIVEHAKTLFHTPYYAPVAGGVLAFVALIGILPVRKKKRPKNTISFPGIRGDVTIELDSVEANLSRVIGKLPEVKKIKVKVLPSEDNRRAVVSADVLMYKGASGVSAHEIANRISELLNDAAVNILGVEEVTKVNLNVRDIIVDAKQLAAAKAQVLAPKAEEPAPAAAVEPAPEEPVADAVAEPIVEEQPAAASPELALGACEASVEEPPSDKSVCGSPEEFSPSFEMIPEVETVEVEPAAAPEAESVPGASTGFESAALEEEDTSKKETESGLKPFEL